MLYYGDMAELLFGTAGIPLSAKSLTTADGIKRIAELGLSCMELEFVQGIYLNQEEAHLVAQAAAKAGVKLSAHAPYFLNFNAHEPKKLRISQGILHRTAVIAAVCGALSVIFHAAFYLGDPPQKAYQTVKKHLSEVLKRLREENINVLLRPEVSGKGSQFGSIAEILDLCAELEGVAPAIDFSHWHARTGGFNCYADFAQILEQIKEKLGGGALDDMHIHVSGIAYGAKGERKHLNLKESDLNYIELLKAFKDYQVGGLLICESPNLEEDARLLKTSYDGLLKEG